MYIEHNALTLSLQMSPIGDLDPIPLTLLRSLCLQTSYSVQCILDFYTSNLGYLINVI